MTKTIEPIYMTGEKYNKLSQSWIGEAATAWRLIPKESRNKVAFMAIVDRYYQLSLTKEIK